MLALNGSHPAFGKDVHILSYFAAYIHILEDVNCVLLCGFFTYSPKLATSLQHR